MLLSLAYGLFKRVLQIVMGTFAVFEDVQIETDLRIMLNFELARFG